MAAKLTRCLCGKVFDPVENTCCPACGAERRVEIQPAPPPADSSTAKTEGTSPAPAVPPKPAPEFPPRPIQVSFTARQLKWAGIVAVAGFAAVAFFRWWPPSPQEKVVVSLDKDLKLKTDAGKEPPKEKEGEAEKKTQPQPDPKPAPTPPPAPVLDPNAPKTWVVDAQNGAGADGAELSVIIGKVRDGDTVTLRPGSYTGGFKIDKKIKIAGESAAGGQAVIKGSGNANLITVTAAGVTFANLQIVQDKMDGAPALILEKGSGVVFENVEAKFNSPLGILGRWVASITATGCTFNTTGGAALLASGHETDGIAQLKFTDCTFSGGQRAFICAMKTRAELRKCRFQNIGHKSEKGAALSTTGEDSQMTVEDCSFNGCRLPVEAENASLSLTNCTFNDNGVGIEPGAFTQGIIAVRKKAKATLTGVTFESNRQGIVATTGSAVELTGCNFSGCGLDTTDAKFATFCVPLCVKDDGTTVTVRKGSFTRSVPHAIYAADGGAVIVEDCDFRATADTALFVGQTTTTPARAEVKQGRFTGNQYGAVITGGGTAMFEDCEFRQNSFAVTAQDAASRAQFTRGTIAENRELGILAQNEGTLIVNSVTIEGNKRGVQAGLPGKPEARATITLADCKLLANQGFDASACQQSRITLNNCSFSPDAAPKIFKEKGAIVTAEPPIEGIVETDPGTTKKGSSTASNNKGSSSRTRSSPPGRPPPPDPVRDIIKAVDSMKRIFHR